MSIYRKNFTFKAYEYNEMIVGGGNTTNPTKATISAEVISSDVIHFSIFNQPSGVAPVFVLPILGSEQGGDILSDRIMYGRLPQFDFGARPMIPVVCEIFNNMNTIRFAFLNPIRIVEFYGQFV
ncbi:MAG: hypothetical protein HDR49_06845 [Bacteroides sp.]|nr:hypothetical protein [Bacteroides sp.]